MLLQLNVNFRSVLLRVKIKTIIQHFRFPKNWVFLLFTKDRVRDPHVVLHQELSSPHRELQNYRVDKCKVGALTRSFG